MSLWRKFCRYCNTFYGFTFNGLPFTFDGFAFTFYDFDFAFDGFPNYVPEKTFAYRVLATKRATLTIQKHKGQWQIDALETAHNNPVSPQTREYPQAWLVNNVENCPHNSLKNRAHTGFLRSDR